MREQERFDAGARGGVGTGMDARAGMDMSADADARVQASSVSGPDSGSTRARANRRKQGGEDRVLYAQRDLSAQASELLVCCVDDTDDLSGATSTGAVAEAIADHVFDLGGHVCLGISRHQLLLAEGVAYTSHNSAMAFMAELPRGRAGDLWARAVTDIGRMRASTSDPGLCMATLPGRQTDAACARQIGLLEEFGQRAKTEVCTKEDAYALAERIPWVRLEELGGTGDGVIGALAGVGLRLGGNDGRFRGQWNLERFVGKAHCEPNMLRDAPRKKAMTHDLREPGASHDALREPDMTHNIPSEQGMTHGALHEQNITHDLRSEGFSLRPPSMPPTSSASCCMAGDLTDALSVLVGGPVRVVDAEGTDLPQDSLVELSSKAKPVLSQGALTFVADAAFDRAFDTAFAMTAAQSVRWRLRQDARKLDDLHLRLIMGGFEVTDCAHFAPDNDSEERADGTEPSCRNCLYRRWMSCGFRCVHELGMAGDAVRT